MLSATLRLTTIAREQVFTGNDLNLYYDFEHPTWYKRPDWFAVAGVPRLYNSQDMRLSYVIWDEKVVPFVVVELISPGTAMSDLGEVKREQNGTPTKWQVYEQILKIPNYVVFDRYTDKFWAFKLIKGQYQQQDVSQGRIWFDEMSIGLGTWQGEFDGITRPWLRWYDVDGKWIPTETERQEHRAQVAMQRAEVEAQRAQMEAQRAQVEAQRADTERQRADRLAERLRSLGLDFED